MDEEKTNVVEGAPEPQEKIREEEKPVKLEKPPKKPGAVSRFFNQFGIGKYWEKLNDYFEHEEKMEKAAAEKEAARETAEDIRAVAESEVGAVKARGAEMPVQIEQSAARAGAESTEAAPIVAEAKVEEAKIEQEAEAAKADLGEEIEILEQKPLLEEVAEQIKAKYEKASLQEVNARIKVLEDEMRAQDARHEEIEQGLKSGKLFKSDKLRAEQENMGEMRDLIKAERDSLLKVKEEKIKMAKELPPVEEFEAIAKEHEEKLPPSVEKIKPVEVLAEEVTEPAEEEMEKAKVEPVPLKKIKKTGEVPTMAAWEDVEPASFGEMKKKMESGKWEPKISAGFKAHLPELSGIMEEAFFAKGEEGSKVRLDRMMGSLEKVGQAYVAQKAAKEISAQDEKALKKWVAETKSAIKVLEKAPEEMKPVKVVELEKPAKRKAKGKRAA